MPTCWALDVEHVATIIWLIQIVKNMDLNVLQALSNPNDANAQSRVI